MYKHSTSSSKILLPIMSVFQIIYFIGMIKQSQVRSFINLISKINHKKSDHFATLPSKTHFHTEPVAESEVTSAQQIPQANGSFQQSSLVIHKKSEANGKGCKIGLLLQRFQTTTKNMDKKNLYDIYRESLEKKKQHLSHLTVKECEIGDFRHREFEKEREREKKYSKELFFPISRTKQHRTSQETVQKAWKKKVSSPTHNKSSQGRHEKNTKLDHLIKSRLFEKMEETTHRLGESQKMRLNKIDYKPVFRVKKYNIQGCLEQRSIESLKIRKEQKEANEQNHSKCPKCSKNKTEISEQEKLNKLGPIFTFKNERYVRSKNRINQLIKVEGWDFDHHEQIEDLL